MKIHVEKALAGSSMSLCFLLLNFHSPSFSDAMVGCGAETTDYTDFSDQMSDSEGLGEPSSTR